MALAPTGVTITTRGRWPAGGMATATRGQWGGEGVINPGPDPQARTFVTVLSSRTRATTTPADPATGTPSSSRTRQEIQ